MKLISFGRYHEGSLTIFTATDGSHKVEWAVKGEVSLGDVQIIRAHLQKQLTDEVEINHVP